jgi:hypothetical protein
MCSEGQRNATKISGYQDSRFKITSALFKPTAVPAVAQHPLLGQGLLIVKASQSHSDTHMHSSGLLWTSDQSDAETSTWQHTNIHRGLTSMTSAGFENAIPASERPHTHVLGAATEIGPLLLKSGI